jgi:hypothetical protein
MLFDLVQIAVLFLLTYLTYRQGDRIDDLEMMMGYILGNLGSKDGDVLGEDDEDSSSYVDGNTAMMIASLNVLGKPFLDELHKNSVFFPTEIEQYLEKKFKWIERDKKIDDIIN